MKKFAKFLAVPLTLALAASVSLFALSACGDDDGKGGKDGGNSVTFEAVDIFGVYELGNDFDLVLDNETTAVLLANAENKQFSGDWSLEESVISATFTEDITPNASAAAAIAEVTEYASIKATVDIADDGRITLQLTSFTYNSAPQSVTEATTPYEPIKNKTEWKELIGLYTTNAAGAKDKLTIKESGYFSVYGFYVLPGGATSTVNSSGTGTINNDTVTLTPIVISYYNVTSAGVKSMNYEYDNTPVSLKIVKSANSISLVLSVGDGSITYVKQ